MKRRGIVIVRGGGDIASGTIHRLHQAGFAVIILESFTPTAIRRTVSFSQAVFDGEMTIEGVTSKLCKHFDEIEKNLNKNIIPVFCNPEGELIKKIKPLAVIDAILAKKNLGTKLEMADIVIGLGPGFVAGVDVHAVIETKRGHSLGRVIYKGSAAENTGEPGNIAGYTIERVMYAPDSGKIKVIHDIGNIVEKDQVVAYVNNKEVKAKIPGMIRGMIQNGMEVFDGMKIADIDPRGVEADYMSVSDKARAIGGGVLEALLHLDYIKLKS